MQSPQMDLKQLLVVSWDVDGTLYSLQRMKYAFLQLCIDRTVSKDALRAWHELIILQRFHYQMRGIRAQGGVIGIGNFPSDRAKLIAIEKRWYGAAIERAGVRPGVLELIDYFHKAGLRQIVVSDYISSYKLHALGLDNMFETSYAGETLGYLKPATNLFRAVTNDLDVDPNRVLHIGDRKDRDGVAASSAGCQVAILGEQYRSARDLLVAIADQ